MSDLTAIHRLPYKQDFDPQVAAEIIASAKVCNVAISLDGQPFSIPVVCAPYRDELLLHGSTASRLFKTLSSGARACVTITHVDALVLARSAFDSSMHYRSLMAFGVARVLQEDEKSGALQVLTEHLFPGRLHDIRPSTQKEMKATTILAFPLDQVSVKVSRTVIEDDEADQASEVWAGYVPIRVSYGDPIPAENLRTGIATPAYISAWTAE